MSQPGEVRRIFSKGKCPAETGTEDFRLVLHNRNVQIAVPKSGKRCMRMKKLWKTLLAAAVMSLTFCLFAGAGVFAEDTSDTGKEPDFTVPIHFTGTDFQNEVWEILRTIPYGQTLTYGEIAKQIAAKKGLSRMSAQAVGGAVGHNEISIIVPCHRVVGANGSLTGYAGGIEKKVELLKLENVDMKQFFIPRKGTAL